MHLLEARGVCKSFGGLKAVQDFSVALAPQALHGLIGPNGAGKTTVFNLLTGCYKPDAGSMTLAGNRVGGLKPSLIAKAGIARTFQNIRLFGELSVLDNVRVGCHLRAGTGMVSSILRTAAHLEEERGMTEKARHLLSIFNLADRENEQAKNLPYGDQRRLEIARALATEPKLLLLDEPAAGMNPQEKKQLRELIQKIRAEFSLTILLIEHDMGVVMDICERITVLDYGEIIAVGTPGEIQCDPKVIEAYLGSSEDLPA